MGKRHNRKRTRSRPRHRDGGNINNLPLLQHNQHPHHIRSESVSTTTSSTSSLTSPSPCSALSATSSTFHPMAHLPRNHWHQTYLAWQVRQNTATEERERAQEVELQRLRIFGGVPGEEDTGLLEPMLKVVTDLFDGFTDYEDPF